MVIAPETVLVAGVAPRLTALAGRRGAAPMGMRHAWPVAAVASITVVATSASASSARHASLRLCRCSGYAAAGQVLDPAPGRVRDRGHDFRLWPSCYLSTYDDQVEAAMSPPSRVDRRSVAENGRARHRAGGGCSLSQFVRTYVRMSLRGSIRFEVVPVRSGGALQTVVGHTIKWRPMIGQSAEWLTSIGRVTLGRERVQR